MIRCTKCKGVNVQIAVWTNPNTGKLIEDYGGFSEVDTKWCEDCALHVLLESFQPEEITSEYLKKLKDDEAPLREHPRAGWCGHQLDYQYCGEYMYMTHSGEVCERGHQGETLAEDPHR